MVYRFCRALVSIVNIIWFNFTFYGKENIPEQGRYVLCANHMSLYDPVVIATQIKRQVHYMAKIELYKNPLLRWLMLHLGTIPVDREHVSMHTMREAMSVLKNDGILGIFPEGTRVHGGRGKPMDGFVVFALKTKSPVLPVRVKGSFKFRGKVDVIFGKPIDLSKYYGKKLKAEEISKISEKIMDNIYDLH